MEESFIHWSSLRGELQSSRDQHHRDGGGLQVRSWHLCRCLPETTLRADFCVCLCACLEMSIREDCLGQCSSRRVISGMPCFVLWSSTWILMDRRKYCWEHMARSQLLFTNALLYLIHLLIIMAVITLDDDCESSLYILVCRNFFVTNSSQWPMNRMGSFNCSGGGASKVLCCLSST